MTNIEFNTVLELLKAFPDEQSCIDHLTELRWNGYVISPFDSTSIVYNCKGNKYKCKNTGKYFNVRTATLFDNTKVSLQKWFLAIFLITSHKKGISSIQLSKDVGVTQKTAWFMLQRIRACFGMDDDKKIGQDFPVEIDETYISGKQSNRFANMKIKNATGTHTKQGIVGMIERNGMIKAEPLKSTTKAAILPVIKKHVEDFSVIFTDEAPLYKKLYQDHEHEAIKHKAREYVRGDIHTNNIESFWALFKRDIYGIYHNVSAKHMKKYVDEFTFRFNSRTCDTTFTMNYLFQHTEVRTTYKSLING